MLNPNINRGRKVRPEDYVSKAFLKQLHDWAMSKKEDYPIGSYWDDTDEFASEIGELVHEVKDNSGTCIDEFPSCCGIMLLENLCSDNLQEQILLLLYSLSIVGINQVVLTDNLKSKQWKETKTVSYQGPITFNPHHKSHVQVYMFTWACMPELVKYLPKAEYNKFFK